MIRQIRKFSSAVLIASLGGVVVQAQQTGAPPAVVTAATNGIGPRIQFFTNAFDFGRVKSGESVKCTYYFTNSGDALLVLHNVQPQCGCTAAGDWTKQVEPGEAGAIPIQFNTLGYNGSVLKQVTVTCNVTNQPMLFLQLKGTVFKPFDVIPALAILNLGPDADSASAVITVTNNTEDPLIITGAECNNRLFSAKLTTNVLGKGYQINVATVPPLPVGSVQGQINLKTAWTNNPVIPVTVVANVQPAVMAIPSYVTLAPGPLPTAVTNSVAIQNNSTNALQLSDPKVNVPGVEAQLKETQQGKSFTAVLTFPQGFQMTPGQQVELNVKTSNPRMPTVTVHVMQMPRPAPPATPAPPALAPTPVSVPAPAPVQVQSAVAPAAPPAAPVKPIRKFPVTAAKLPPLPPAPSARAK